MFTTSTKEWHFSKQAKTSQLQMINKVPSWCKVWNKLRIQLAWYLYALNLAGLEGRCSTILNFCLLAVMSTSLGYCWISVQIVSLGRDQVFRPFCRLHLELRDMSLIKDHNRLNFCSNFSLLYPISKPYVFGAFGEDWGVYMSALLIRVCPAVPPFH